MDLTPADRHKEKAVGVMLLRHHNWIRSAGLAIVVIAALSTAWFAMRSYRTYLQLQSAYALGMLQASTLRAWMTLRHIASAYRVPEAHLFAGLDLPPTTLLDLSLRTIAERQSRYRLQQPTSVPGRDGWTG